MHPFRDDLSGSEQGDLPSFAEDLVRILRDRNRAHVDFIVLQSANGLTYVPLLRR